MRIGWLEAACIVAIGVATLQLPVAERGARLFTPPPLTMALPMLKGLVVADNTTAERQVREHDDEGKR